MILKSIILHLLLTSTASRFSSNETQQFTPQMINSSLVIDIVSGLHERIKFKNFVFFISERLHRDTDTATRFLHDVWDAFPTAPIMIIINNNYSLVGLLSRPTLCLIMTTERDDPIMKLAALSLKSIRYFRTMFLLFPLGEYDELHWSFGELRQLYENIHLLYEWVWLKQFLNTMLITIKNNIYLYDPYPIGRVLNKSINWSLDDFFRKDKLDLMGQEFKIPMYYDLPRVFGLRRYPNKGRNSRLSGTSGKLFEAFVRSINGSFNDSAILEHEFEPFDLKVSIAMVKTQKVEISVHSYTDLINSSVGTSYPISINDFCIMVPFHNSTPMYMYLQKSFQLSCWFLLCSAALYITLGIWLCSPIRKRDITLSFLESLRALMLIPPFKLITLPLARLRFLFVLLFVVGFCISNMFLTKMASNLTASSNPAQIDTIQDIIDANLQIMILDLEYNALLDMTNRPAFLKLILSVSKQVMDKHRNCLNTSYGYTVASDRWNFLNKQQRYLKKPLFRLTSICSGPFYHVFPLYTDSHLLQPLKNFILAVSQSGYIFFWDEEAFDDALFLGYVEIFKNYDGFAPLSINFFRSICLVWCFGLLLAGITLLFEIKRLTWAKVVAAVRKWIKWLKRKI